MKKLHIVFLLFGIFILVTCIVLFVLKFQELGVKGLDGKEGLAGTDQIPLPNSFTSFASSSPTFVSSSAIVFGLNDTEKIVSSSFVLNVIASTSLSAGDTLPIVNLPTLYQPLFAKGCLGTAFNMQDSSDTHAIIFNQSQTPNVQFCALSAINLLVSKQYQVHIASINTK